MGKQSQTIKELAKRGEQHDVMDALRLLTDAYVSMCGGSLEYRTVVFYSLMEWQVKLAWLDLPLSEMARKDALVDMLPLFSNKYNPDVHDNFYTTGLDNEQLRACSENIVQNDVFDKVTTEVLCWGVLKSLTKENLTQEIESVAEDGALLKGKLIEQDCGKTVIEMSSPYHLWAKKDELVRYVNGLLIAAYNDCQWLRGKENVVRDLFSEYQKKLSECKYDDVYLLKEDAFCQAYKDFVDNSVIFPIDMSWLFQDWFDLKFHTSRFD